MQSKTFCCNKTVFRKNLTRFAPAWGLYLVCLLLGMTMMYTDGTNARMFWFAHYMGECIQVMAVVNLLYAPVVAQLLFGDLYSSRMCNALHAMPLRRESWFGTNFCSGLTFSLVPTAIMALLSIPLLMGTKVEGAWLIAPLWFVASNLQFVCFFGISILSVFLTGNRIIMAVAYAAINGAAMVVYFLVEIFYTPMLYGILTPTDLVILLTPVFHMIEGREFVVVSDYAPFMEQYKQDPLTAAASFTLDESYGIFLGWAAVGLVCTGIALALYRKRELECAGDALAVKALAPVFQLGCGVTGLAGGALVMGLLGLNSSGTLMWFLLPATGMSVGWFAGKMFLERSIRVFAPKNWIGLGAMAAVILVSLGLTKMDILGISTWTPDPEEVEYVSFSYNDRYKFTDPQAIADAIRIHEIALTDRLERSGTFPEQAVITDEQGRDTIDLEALTAFNQSPTDQRGAVAYRYADNIWLNYVLKDGRRVQRRLYIWADREAGDLYSEYMSRWEVVGDFQWHSSATNPEGTFDPTQVDYIRIGGTKLESFDQKTVDGLYAAIQADCAERTMTQSESYHTGFFTRWEEEYEEEYMTRGIYITLRSGDYGWGVDVYADSRHTLQWLEDQGLMHWQVHHTNVYEPRTEPYAVEK